MLSRRVSAVSKHAVSVGGPHLGIRPYTTGEP